jgi:hydrogenase small subunit
MANVPSRAPSRNVREVVLIMGPTPSSDPTSPSISEIDVLWITAGLGCDGDTIAMTAATQPSIEDIVLGALPWIPKVHFYNPFLASDNGEDFMAHFHRAARGESNPPRDGGLNSGRNQ